MTTKPENVKGYYTKVTCISDGKTTYVNKNRLDHDELIARIHKEWNRL